MSECERESNSSNPCILTYGPRLRSCVSTCVCLCVCVSAFVCVLLLCVSSPRCACWVSDSSSEEGLNSLGSPGEHCLASLAWSLNGKYLASAMEKMVNIWQVNGKHPFSPLFPPGFSTYSFVFQDCIKKVIFVGQR